MEWKQGEDAGSRSRVVVVSADMTVLVRPFAIEGVQAPGQLVALACDAGDACMRFVEGREVAALADGDPASRVVLLLNETVFARVGGGFPRGIDARFQLPVELRPIVRAMLDCTVPGEAGDLYSAAKGIELICEAVRLLEAGALVPLAADMVLNHADTRRILDARRLIEERWQERLTLEGIAGQCGVNREKLRRGFRALFSCTVAEAISERRLGEASHMLRSTDLPVSSIGYRSGYLNNASFSRAFVRRFGVTPSDYRAGRLAA
ncbi:helix-turn-helix transcriptional regulator [Sphingomonas sp. CGMCC 1.13654]|uniref:Helix-turn-helix transcriptional regulator n=1 Tax=Sphingomonas chungangi TaxID=2683589 RepID=A0A838L9W2_9SPHN|nr:AraC family transcriptional regulator [Sphingomonas chungangi]MBA2934298.1 helix-turn-helix transcriptional regulator [Sphingomonas chungangi]MVW57339.1 helix-turn-helix domain-containing protein [Sphingomonas chungangi]